MPRIRRLLIPNRGEIALRIVRAARALGIETVVAHSACDAAGLAARMADSAVLLGPSPPGESYLDAGRIVAAARRAGCQAVHPGYGFLSEREELARAVEEAGLTYIGPTPENIRLLGDKLAARRTLAGSGIPVTPSEMVPLGDPSALAAAAARVGYPLLLKAASGGGGKGIRLVRRPEDLPAAYRLASSEARGAFGSSAVFAERYLERARHVEVQVLGDGRGGIRVFPERDCSLQRRYQKLLEETPSPALDPEARSRVQEMAGRIASLARYRGAGTVEFLLSEEGSFHFLEVNARLQVEHPITEMVTGVDLVAEQIAIAEGRTYPPVLESVDFRGSAIELRLNAEDPQLDFRPSTGRIGAVRLPGGPGVRVDSALFPGLEVLPHYDSLLAKVIAWGEDRDEAIRRLRAAFGEMLVTGVATTLPLAAPLLADRTFLSGAYHCQHLESLLSDPEFFTGPPPGEEERRALAVVAAHLRRTLRQEGPGAPDTPAGPPGASASGEALSPWVRAGRARGLNEGARPSPQGWR